MANVSKRERDRNIYSAATYFATVTRDAKKIAALYNTTERTIQRWAEEPQWMEMLDFLGYTGDRTFRVAPQRDVERDNADILDTARKLFLENAKKRTVRLEVCWNDGRGSWNFAA